VAFIVFAAIMATAISATIGVATLCSAGVQPWVRFSELWLDWWLGDALGALVFAPAILATSRTPAAWSRREWVETCFFVIATAVMTQVVFGRVFAPNIGQHPFEYVIFCLVIVVAVRLGQPTTALVVLAASTVTVWNTVRGAGPFAGPTVHQSLILLQVFMGVLAGTGLLLAAAIAERKTSERRRAAAHAVGEVLAGAPALTEATPAVLQAICESLEWQIGALWLVDHSAQRLRCLSAWTGDRRGTTPFLRVTEETLFPSGVGLPGRVWATGKAAWIEDCRGDNDTPQGPTPARGRLQFTRAQLRPCATFCARTRCRTLQNLNVFRRMLR
jgi:predicted small secreted protein